MNPLQLPGESDLPMAWTIGQLTGLGLWLGLAVLTLALLILTRTRWGQAKPLGKCVALSIFAHVLLGGYAYGTKLIFTVPVVAEPEVAPIKMVEVESEPAPDDVETKTVQPWNRFAPVDSVIEEGELASEVGRQQGESTSTDIPSGFDSEPIEATSEIPNVSRPPVVDSATPSWATTQAPTTTQAVAASALSRPDRVSALPSASSEEEWEFEIPSLQRPTTEIEISSADRLLPEVNRVTLQEVFDASNTQESDLVSGIDQLFESTTMKLPRAEVKLTDPGPLYPTRDNANNSDRASVDTLLNEAQSLQDLVAAVPARRRLGDGQPLPQLYQLRDQRHRSKMVLPLGGSPETEIAVKRALNWLVSVQESDGRWDASRFGAGDDTHVHGQVREAAGAEADTGVTALAVLAFLAADQTHLEGEHQETVQNALQFLIRSQEADGNLAGDAAFFAKMYCHGMATLAVSEALAITGDRRLRSTVEAAVRFTRQAQHPQTGGWRYQPRDRGDMSQFGWQVMALRSAEQAGIKIPESCRLGMHHFLDSTSSGNHNGLCAYRAGEAPTPTMTSEGLVCRYFLDYERGPQTLKEASGLILRDIRDSNDLNLYYFYYGTLAMYQHGGDQWDVWNERMKKALLPAQRQDEGYVGSWDPDTRWGGYGGRVYSTAMAALCLEVYYRYLPIYRLNDPTPAGLDQSREARIRIPSETLR